MDIAFQDYVALLTGKEQYETLSPVARRRMINGDFDRIKRRFGDEEDDEDKYSVELRGVKDDLENGIIDGTVTFER